MTKINNSFTIIKVAHNRCSVLPLHHPPSWPCEHGTSSAQSSRVGHHDSLQAPLALAPAHVVAAVVHHHPLVGLSLRGQ